MSGYDCQIMLHLHDDTWEHARTSAMDAEKLLNSAGFTITVGPTLPHMPLIAEDGDDS